MFSPSIYSKCDLTRADSIDRVIFICPIIANTLELQIAFDSTSADFAVELESSGCGVDSLESLDSDEVPELVRDSPDHPYR